MSAISNIFGRVIPNKKNQVNTPVSAGCYGLTLPWATGRHGYADAYLWIILNKIFSGLKNVDFYAIGDADNKALAEVEHLATFIENNINELAWWWWSFGYMVIGRDEVTNTYFIPDPATIRKDKDGAVIGYEAVIYADSYLFEKKSTFDIIRGSLRDIDTLRGASEYLTESLGAFGVMSGKATPVSAADKEDFLNKIKRDIGISRDKYQLMIMTHPVEISQFNLPIKDLELREKIMDEIKLIAGYFSVPYDLIPFSGQSTYANQEQAVKQFYSNCIAPIAESVLSLGRYIIKKNKQLLVKSDVLTFKIDNVPELQEDRDKELEYNKKLVAYAKELAEIGVDITFIKKQLENKL